MAKKGKGHYQGPAVSRAQFRFIYANHLEHKWKHNWTPKGLWKSLPDYTGGGTLKSRKGEHHKTPTGSRHYSKSPSTASLMRKGVNAHRKGR